MLQTSNGAQVDSMCNITTLFKLNVSLEQASYHHAKRLWQGTQKLLVASAKCYILFKGVDMQYMLGKSYILQQNSCLSSERVGKYWCKVPDFRAGTIASAVSKAMEITFDEDYKVFLEYKWLMLKHKNDVERSVRSRMQKIGKSSIPAAFAVHFFLHCLHVSGNTPSLHVSKRRIVYRRGNSIFNTDTVSSV